MFFSNGAIVQQLNMPTDYISSSCVNYLGINAFYQHPLCGESDSEARLLSEEVLFIKTDDELFLPLEFISNSDLLYRYVLACVRLNIPIRVLFIESTYPFEKWKETLPSMRFIGYEYCEIPFDSQIITDLDWYEPFKKFHNILNEYGLFATLEDALRFKSEYDYEFDKGHIGDGEMSTYVCKVYEVDINKMLET